MTSIRATNLSDFLNLTGPRGPPSFQAYVEAIHMLVSIISVNDGALRRGYMDRITIATGAILPSLELQISIHRFI